MNFKYWSIATLILPAVIFTNNVEAENLVYVEPMHNVDQIQKDLIKIPKKQTFEKISLSSSARVSLYYSLSGSVRKTEIEKLLNAIDIDAELRKLPAHWQLAIHGNEDYVQISIYPECSWSKQWVLTRKGDGWDVIDFQAIPGVCIEMGPVQ